MSTRLVAAFSGEVQCARETGAVNWRLSGADRDGASALDVMLCGVSGGLELPARLPAAELHVGGDPANPLWELRSAGEVRVLAARSVQVHRGAAAAFARALPSISAPWTVRAGWALLLDALRVPGVPRLLRTLRRGNNASESNHHE
ncbi:MAG: hypothetical protein ACRES2_08170 [Steroidobacteraceae bacterium]